MLSPSPPSLSFNFSLLFALFPFHFFGGGERRSSPPPPDIGTCTKAVTISMQSLNCITVTCMTLRLTYHKWQWCVLKAALTIMSCSSSPKIIISDNYYLYVTICIVLKSESWIHQIQGQLFKRLIIIQGLFQDSTQEGANVWWQISRGDEPKPKGEGGGESNIKYRVSQLH